MQVLPVAQRSVSRIEAELLAGQRITLFSAGGAEGTRIRLAAALIRPAKIADRWTASRLLG